MKPKKHKRQDCFGLISDYSGCRRSNVRLQLASFGFHPHSTENPPRNDEKKVAFTLAEVLITLGIIGVVAAMTLPTLIANKKATELQTALKKNVSVLSQALLMVEQEKGESLKYMIGSSELKPLLMKHLKVLRDCGYGSEAKACVNSSNLPYKNYNNTNTTGIAAFDDGQFMLNDGSFIMIENQKNLWISVDVNGFKKGPNRWGHDLFTFDLASGKFLPMGSPGSLYEGDSLCLNSSSITPANGISCTYKALTEKDYFKNLPK